MSPKETQQLRRIAGQLNWISTQTRPGMDYAASIVSGLIKDARVRDLITANKFLKILKSTEVVLSFFGILKYGGSQGKMIVFIEIKWETYPTYLAI